jgi:serine/threonine protein kinase/Tol biopolymer transport system component
MPIPTGTRFDRYQILAPLGMGGMGEVYLAHDTKLGRKVALKLLPEKYTKDPQRLRRFEQEAQAASALNHPNIITIHEIGEAEGIHFIATEFIEGNTLRRLLAKRRLSINEIIEIALQVTNALSAAHAAGIVHRDIKPENIMVRPDGYVKVLDFGLAKLADRGDSPQQPATADTSPGLGLDTPTAAEELYLETIEQLLTDEQSGKDKKDKNDQLADSSVSAQPAAQSQVSLGSLSDGGQATVADLNLGNTLPGLVIGTLHYMSPEQARGLRVDTRTDLFSLGTVLYEMLTGRTPFNRPTPKGILAAILTEEPLPISHFRPETPDLLDWITAKALVKDREERYQTAREMRNDLKRLQHRLEIETEVARSKRNIAEAEPANPEWNTTGSIQSVSTASQQVAAITSQTEQTPPTDFTSGATSLASRVTAYRQRHPLNSLVLSLLVLGVIGFIAYQSYSFVISRRGGPLHFQQMRVSRFTSSGKAQRAAISPDGKYVVYATGESRGQSLSVRQVATASSVEIVPEADVIYRGLTFSPDGNYIYYVVQEGNNPIQVLYQVPVLGGTPRKLLSDIDSPVTLSPDGAKLAFIRRVRGQREDVLMIADSNGSNQQKVATRAGSEFFQIAGPAWSPDGKIIVSPAGSREGGRHTFYVAVNLADSRVDKIADLRWANAGRAAWLPDGKGLIVSGTEAGATQSQIWQIAYPSSRSGAVRRVTNDLNDYRDLSLTADARALVTVQTEAHVNVWLVPNGEAHAAKQITSGVGQYNGVRGLTWTPDGRLVFVSRQSGGQDIWSMNADGSNQRQLTTEPRADVYPAVTPDGRYVVFSSARTGNSNVYRMALDGSNQTRLTSGPGEEFLDVASDSQSVIYTATGSTMYTLWRVPIDGGTPVQLTDKLSQWPAASPDGRWIACWYREETKQPWRVALLPATGGAPSRFLDTPPTADPSLPVRWLPTSRAISFVDNRNGVSNVWSLALEGGELKQLTNFSSEQIFWFDWSRDGKQLACSRGLLVNDVVLLTAHR